MSPYWISVGHNSMTGAHIRREKEDTDIQGEHHVMMVAQTGINAATRQGTLKIAGSHQKTVERLETGFPSASPRKN